MPYKDKQSVEFITIAFPKGSKKLLRRYAVENECRSVSEVVRVAVDTLMAQKAKEEAVASEIRGIE